MKTKRSTSIISKSLLFMAILFTVGTVRLAACEISFEVIKNKKEKYDIGDIIVVKVTVIYTHRICLIGIQKTEFQTSGLKVIGTKEWVEVKMGVYERELKIKVTGTKKGKVFISAVRKCEKEGGFGTLELEAEPLKD